jgi:hypothetical protein
MKIGQFKTFRGAKTKAPDRTMRSGVILASRTPREVGTCVVENAFQRVKPTVAISLLS